jgi:hypothetical protein
MARYVVELQGQTSQPYLKFALVPKSKQASKSKRSSPYDVDACRCEINGAHMFATVEGAQAFIDRLGLRPDRANVKRIDNAGDP